MGDVGEQLLAHTDNATIGFEQIDLGGEAIGYRHIPALPPEFAGAVVGFVVQYDKVTN